MARNANTNTLEQVLEGLSEDQPKTQRMEQAAQASVEMAEAERQTRELHHYLKNEEKVSVMLAPMYQPYFGEVMPVYLNGLPIFVPVDGRSYSVPKSYACIIHGRRRGVDDMLMKTRRMSNVQQNAETFMGELQLIPR